jgi:hypothetical protein
MSETTRQRRKLTWTKRLLFAGLLFVLTVLGVELLSWTAIRFFTETSLERLRGFQELLADTGVSAASDSETIHPYLGWVLNPQTNPGRDADGRFVPVNRFGFLDDEIEIPKRSPDRFVVAVAGGSVAWQMSAYGEQALLQTLRESPALADREIQLVRLAIAGHKQPQQLMALNYLLALGAEFDVVVNVDGYNEIALSVCENAESGVFVAYPRMWHARTMDIVDPREYSQSFQVLKARATRQRLAQEMRDSWLKWSPTRNFIWMMRDKWLQREMNDIGTELLKASQAQGLGFARQGPPQLYQSSDGVFEHATDLWDNSSRQLDRLCRANGTLYLHVLQPNQYLPGSKPMGAQERGTAIYDDQKYGQAIAQGYPLLIRRGEALRAAGVQFHDMTMLFAEISDPIYVDLCCHYNKRGNALLAQAVAREIVAAWEIRDSEQQGAHNH